MKLQFGRLCSSLFQRSQRDYKAEQARYFEKVKLESVNRQRGAVNHVALKHG
jgi:hypothetical protein